MVRSNFTIDTIDFYICFICFDSTNGKAGLCKNNSILVGKQSSLIGEVGDNGSGEKLDERLVSTAARRFSVNFPWQNCLRSVLSTDNQNQTDKWWNEENQMLLKVDFEQPRLVVCRCQFCNSAVNVWNVAAEGANRFERSQCSCNFIEMFSSVGALTYFDVVS